MPADGSVPAFEPPTAEEENGMMVASAGMLRFTAKTAMGLPAQAWCDSMLRNVVRCSDHPRSECWREKTIAIFEKRGRSFPARRAISGTLPQQSGRETATPPPCGRQEFCARLQLGRAKALTKRARMKQPDQDGAPGSRPQLQSPTQDCEMSATFAVAPLK